MAAAATTTPPDVSPRSGPAVPQVEQPPRTIEIAGSRVDISHLTGDDLYEMLLKDEEQWDYKRIAAESQRSVARVRRWVMNAYTAERTGQVEDDKTFIPPEGHIGGSPWWRAGKARHVLNQIGVMTRDGRAIPHRPTGRTPGAKDLAPRRRWSKAPVRDTAAAIYREYRQLMNRKTAPLSEREARAELCRRHNLSRTQLGRRINEGRQQVEAEAAGKSVTRPALDDAELRTRLEQMIAEKRAAGYSARGAEERARAALAEEVGLTRRQLAARTPGVGSAV